MRNCKQCGNEILSRRNKEYCSRACSNKTTAQSRDPHFKGGGRKTSSQGYTMIMTRTGYEYEHRLFMEHYLGRALEEWEQVHHINGVKQDNSRANLEVMTVSEHMSHHAKLKVRDRDEKGRYK